MEGFKNTFPKVNKIAFSHRGKMDIYFADGRIVIVPLQQFPGIKKLTLKQRRKWQSLGEGFTFEDCNEVYHVEQVLGSFEAYKHR